MLCGSGALGMFGRLQMLAAIPGGQGLAVGKGGIFLAEQRESFPIVLFVFPPGHILGLSKAKAQLFLD